MAGASPQVPEKHRREPAARNSLVDQRPRSMVIGLAFLSVGWAGSACAQTWGSLSAGRTEAAAGSELVHPVAPGGEATGGAQPEVEAASGDDSPETSQVSLALARLLDSGLVEAERFDAARTLVGMIESDEGRLAVVGMLRSSADDSSAKWLLVRALAREPALPEALLPALTELAGASDGDRLARVLSAIGSIRTGDALRLVARFLGPEQVEPVRTAALASLVRATGHDEIGASAEAWTQVIERWAPAGGSNDRPSGGLGAWIVRGLSDRAERQTARARELSTRLTETQRRLYVATDVAQRPALVASMLRDDVPEVRTLAFELVERELVSTPTPAAEVVAAIVDLLRNPAAGVRAQAAGLLGRIAPEGAGDAVASALVREQDSAAAAALLTAASRWPGPSLREPVLRWLENGPGTRPVAAEAALAMQRAGQWTAEDVERIASAMRRVQPTDLTPAGCRLVAAIGSSDDVQRLSQLLMTGGAAQRSAVADSLTGRPEFVDAILAAADRDAALISAAARAVAACRPNLQGFRSIARLPCADEALRRAALRIVGESLRTGALLSAADETGGDTASTLWLLERALTLAQQSMAAGEDGSLELVRESAERLARQRLELGRPAEAIAALDAAPEASPTSRLTALRVVALIVLGRVEDARRLGAGAEAWLDGLERCVGMDQAGDVVEVIREDLVPQMEPAQLQRFEALAARVQASAEARLNQADRG